MTKKILILDDDVDLCEELAEVLKDEGYYVESLYDGAEGQMQIKKNAYDIIILDYRMPGLNGVEILKFIKSKNLKTKIFIASGKPFIEKLLADEDLSSLVTCVINKPFDAGALLEKISVL